MPRPSKTVLLALRISTARADEAAFLISQQAAAVRALAGDISYRAVVSFYCSFFIMAVSGHCCLTLPLDTVFQYGGNGIGTGQY